MIVCDTGPIFAAADRKDADHQACVDLFTNLRRANRRLLLPQTVLAEVGYMLETKLGTFAEVAFLKSVANRTFELISLTQADVTRVAELVARYDNLPLGTTDASVIALAERLGVDEIATLDHRHFRVVRPNRAQVLTLLPERGP
ncbi:twitching motility protein PilT [Mycobacterium sp. NS-7484]|uniref:type II toxin-antitoxin system VapC family toxin n=1 Tax=Mycobacterium sp. NS-7484 TaxID=1834161 RepID=UPI00096CAB9B|nr:PIN domain-containing protein [Mycobacterium sp. NS-7484]OMC00500.1 twitching motility protein PilT [Mycobacterium sp. NS-7484]